jgi:hypothetical protein
MSDVLRFNVSIANCRLHFSSDLSDPSDSSESSESYESYKSYESSAAGEAMAGHYRLYSSSASSDSTAAGVTMAGHTGHLERSPSLHGLHAMHQVFPQTGQFVNPPPGFSAQSRHISLLASLHFWQ